MGGKRESQFPYSSREHLYTLKPIKMGKRKHYIIISEQLHTELGSNFAKSWRL